MLQKIDNSHLIQYITSHDFVNPSLQLHLNQTYLMTTVFTLP